MGLFAAVAWIASLVVFGAVLDSSGTRTTAERTLAIGYSATSLGIGITGLIMFSGRRVRLAMAFAIASIVPLGVAYGIAASMERRSVGFVVAASASVAILGATALGALAWLWTAGGGGARVLARLRRVASQPRRAPWGVDAAFKLVFLVGGGVLFLGATVLTVLALSYRIWEGVLVFGPWIYVGGGGFLIGLRWGRDTAA